MAFDYGSLLSGATGMLGLGGSGGGIGTTPAAPSATAGDINNGDIVPSVSGVSGGGFSFTPTVNVAFPNAKLSATRDTINPPETVFAGNNLLLIGGVGLGIVFLILIFLRK